MATSSSPWDGLGQAGLDLLLEAAAELRVARAKAPIAHARRSSRAATGLASPAWLDDDGLTDQYAKCLSWFSCAVSTRTRACPLRSLAEPVTTTRAAVEVVWHRRHVLHLQRCCQRGLAACLLLMRSVLRAGGQGRGWLTYWGRDHRPAPVMRVAYYLPLPPDGLGLLTTACCPCLSSGLNIKVAKRRRPPHRSDVALYHVGNNPDAHGGSSRRYRSRGIVVH